MVLSRNGFFGLFFLVSLVFLGQFYKSEQGRMTQTRGAEWPQLALRMVYHQPVSAEVCDQVTSLPVVFGVGWSDDVVTGASVSFSVDPNKCLLVVAVSSWESGLLHADILEMIDRSVPSADWYEVLVRSVPCGSYLPCEWGYEAAAETVFYSPLSRRVLGEVEDFITTHQPRSPQLQ